MSQVINLKEEKKTFLVTCLGCGKRFPLNPNKHTNRNKRYCPRCREMVIVETGYDGPNLDWLRKILHRKNKEQGIPNKRRDARMGSKW